MSTVDIHEDFVTWGAPDGCQVVDVADVRLIVANHLEYMAARYPAEIFGDEGKTSDSIAGTALRIVLTNEALRLRGEAE